MNRREFIGGVLATSVLSAFGTPAGKGIVDFAEVKRLMELEGVAPRYTVHYDYDFPEDEAGARKFAMSDLSYYRSVFG